MVSPGLTLDQGIVLTDEALFQSAPLPEPAPPDRTYQLEALAEKPNKSKPVKSRMARKNFKDATLALTGTSKAGVEPNNLLFMIRILIVCCGGLLVPLAPQHSS